MNILGVDPGGSGGLAILDSEDHSVETILMPTMCEGIIAPTEEEGNKNVVDGERFNHFIRSRIIDFAIIEHVGSMSGQGVKSMFTFGAAYGGALSLLHNACIPYKLVRPARWKKDLNLPGGRENKHLSNEMATKLFPRAAQQFARVKDNGRAEAALIAYWWLKSGLEMRKVA